ncbi:MAG: hypothetical protein M3N47_02365, partial [Chloroflexota bacterium]|nr:hypothetical protein [Chloroflexota bacterium]
MVVVPAVPYRGIQPFRYVDHPIFFAREHATRQLIRLVDVYRGVFLYGDSGNGKSSLVNAGLLPQARELGFDPVVVRVQPRAGEELVIEPIRVSEDSGAFVPCVLAPDDEDGQVVLSIADFEQAVRDASREHQPLIIFDQFEELLTLFEDDPVSRTALAEMIVRLLRDSLPVKLLFAFREDYLGRVKQLLHARPELVDQALRLGPPPAESLQTIIRGPFERHPRHFKRELEPKLAERLEGALAERFGSGEVSLSEVQTVCLRLWQSPDPDALLAAKGVQGLLEDELGAALDAFAPDLRAAAIALLSQMVTSAGTRNVISAEDLRHRVAEEDEEISPALLDEALDRLERDSRLIRRERRRDIYLYEITSEFLVPWISQRRQETRLEQQRRRDELRRQQERAQTRRRLVVIAGIAGGLVMIAAIVAVLGQRAEAQRQAANATSLALTAASVEPLRTSRPDVSLGLAFEAHRARARPESRAALINALLETRRSGLRGVITANDVLYDVAFSPDGKTLASASANNTVRLWNPATGKQQARLRGHTAPVFAVAFSPDGKTLASASDDNTVRLWNPATGTQKALLHDHTDWVYD